MIVKGLAVFFVSFIFDIVWTYCIQCVSSGKIFAASVTSAALVALGSFTTIEYIADNRMIIFAMLGAFFGTIVTMKFANRA
jgi:ABC-type transport system involved in cytochrome c biogenesis permease subunit